MELLFGAHCFIQLIQESLYVLIQIEQLFNHGATETIILTVNLSDGTLSQLGSETAKGFLEGQDEMKVKFLSHCLNSHLCRNRINSDGMKTKKQSDKRLFQDKQYFIETSDQELTQPKCDTNISLRKNQIPGSDLLSDQNITGHSTGISEYSKSVENWHHNIQPTVGDSNSDDKDFLPDNFDTPSANSYGNEETDYIIEENVEKIQENANETVDGLSSETKETVILEPVSNEEQSDLQTDLAWIKTEPAVDGSVTIQSENNGLPGAREKTFPNILPGSVVNNTDFDVKLSSLDISPAQYSGQPKSKPSGEKIGGKFECVKCGKSFKTHQNLQVHDRIHLGLRPFGCDVCNQRFYQSSHLRTHMLKHSGLKRFTCTYCSLKFYTRSNLRSHERIHTGEKPYKCKHCGKAFTHSASVSSHIYWNHKDLYKDIDLKKSGSVPDGSDLSRSEPSAALPLFLRKIDSANGQTETEMDLSEPAGLLPLFSRNIDTTTGHTEREVDNSVEKESTNISLQDQTSGRFDEPLAVGFEADQSTKQSNMHADHLHVLIKDEHVKAEPLLNVDRAFQEESTKACGNGALGKIYSTDLIKNDNLDKTGDMDSGGFDSGHFPVSELYADVRNARARTSKCKKRKRPDSKFECTKCGKSFKTQQNLQVHDRIHSGIRPFNCDICGQRFNQRTHLQAHVRIHTGERPYACTLCPQTFTTSSNLRLHERRHTRQKPYHCNYCEKKFTQISSLSSHLKRIHMCSI